MSIIAIILLGIIDYYGYNYYGFKFENMYCNKYRFCILFLQLFFSVFLILFSDDLYPLINFWLLWWFGAADFVYYLFERIIKNNEKFFEWNNKAEMCWLYFTPYGLIKKIFFKKWITKKEFLIQLIIGILIILILNINERIY